jgi:uncharacterized RmlC-like cupin family protein
MSYPPPRYLHADPEVSAVLRPAETPHDLAIGGKTKVGYLATGATTEGRFGLYRWDMNALPNGPGAHFHRTIAESFFVLEGEVSLYDGATWNVRRAGDFLYVPPGGIHAFSNESGAPASMLILFTPGAPRERYFEELAEIAASGRELGPQEWTELYHRHDQYEVPSTGRP